MADNEKQVEEVVVQEMQDADSVRISPDVISVVAGIAASEVKGVAGMSGGIVGGIAERLGRKDLTKGIKVHLDEDRIKIDINIIVEMGIQILEVANNLKKELRDAVEKITGMQVSAINVHVLGINIPRDKDSEEKPAAGSK